ncbi:MAG: rod-binding protein [Planctomycetia bacterium]|nr:rod-binding protein [Planctomycetia bacterium]
MQVNAVGNGTELHKAAVAFEGFFHSMLLRAMRKGVPEGKLFHGGRGEQVFRGMQDDLLAERMAEGGGLGIARMIEQEFGRGLDIRG